MNNFISNPNKLIDEVWQDKDVNIIERQHALGHSKFYLFDISLNSSGQDEDRKYVQSAFYRDNIRRGNTVIEYVKKKNKFEWARKGTPKILDIKLQHIQYLRNKKNITKQERVTSQIIFEGVNHAFKEGKRVQLVKTQKANGQNAQVSYNYELNAWVICSKNVSLVAANIKDLQKYTQNRYKFATLIAQQWFKQIEHLNKQEIRNLKGLLDGFTAIGEYCGNPSYQHLVKYDEVRIKWFALVDNNSSEYCFDPFKAKKQLQKFNLKFVKIKNIIVTSNPDNFYDSLQKLYLKTAQAGLEDGEYGMQGSIVYFVVQQIKDKSSKAITVGAGKLKTLEYRYFRKIRQKMSRFIKKKQSHQFLINSYLKQIAQLQQCNESRTIFPHQYYSKILKAGLQLTEHCKLRDEQLRGKFISILKLLFYIIFKKINISKHGNNLMKDHSFRQKISQIPFMRYGGLGCSNKIIYMVLGLPGMFKSYLASSMKPHFQKINANYEILEFTSQQQYDKITKYICQSTKKQKSLQHYFLDGCINSELVLNLVTDIRKYGDKKCFYKFVLVRDQIKQNQMFQCDQYNQYPFRMQTIIMCYLGQLQHTNSSSTIQQKIDKLIHVTQKLKQTRNISNFLTKMDITIYPYPFSFKSTIQNIQQFEAIIRSILLTDDEKVAYNQYCLLILRLEKIKGLQYLDEQNVDKQIKHLIQGSYPSIPTMLFKGQNS